MPELAWIALETDPMKSMGITPPPAPHDSGDIIGEIKKSARTRNRPLAPTASPWRNDVPQITLIEGVTQALAYEMKNDLSVVVLGEDVGVNGGVFRATQGLQQRSAANASSTRRSTNSPSPASPSASPRRA
jgi:hypothetical protein